MAKQKTRVGKQLIFPVLSLTITIIFLAMTPKTSLNQAGYQLSSGWHIRVNNTLPAGAVCDRAYTQAGFPFVKARADNHGGGCDDSVNNAAKILNFFAALAVGAGLGYISVKSFYFLQRGKNV